MCGIAGLYNNHHALSCVGDGAKIVRDMTQSMAHRGPDADGFWVDQHQRCILGHRRLSIIDTSEAGLQPRVGASGRWVICFNGEIYNFEDIRRELQDKSVVIHGRTDTEVLIESIALWGVDALAKIDGMYAFAAFDTVTGEMLLARDPFGEKPLYYMETVGGGIAFASELQALEKVPGFDGTVDVNALSEMLMFQYIGAPRSIYKTIKKLPPGHWMRVMPGRDPEIKRFFRFAPGSRGYTSHSIPQLADELEDILTRSLKRRLIADVPLGAFLSGGVDSSTVCALARRKLDISLKTFSIGFAGDKESEHEIARKIAKHLGTEHQDKIISPSAIDFLNQAGTILDEPNADSSCLPTYFLSQFARQHVTVALSGDGGDELFGGYGRYLSTLQEEQQHAQIKDSRWSAGQSYYGYNRILNFNADQLCQLFGFIPKASAEHIKGLITEIDNCDVELLHRLRASDVENYMPGAVLPKVDRMSMQQSLEVRTPFLNVELARFCEMLPSEYLASQDRGKILLKEISYRYLPREIIDLPKKGFGLPLTAGWGKSNLIAALRKCLDEDSPLGNWIGAERMQAFVDAQASNNGFSIYQTWSVIMLDQWLKKRPAILPDRDTLDVISPKSVSGFFSRDINSPIRMLGLISPNVLIISKPVEVTKEYDVSIEEKLSKDDICLIHKLNKNGLFNFNNSDNTFVPKTFYFDPEWDIQKCLNEAQINLQNYCVIILDVHNHHWLRVADVEHLRTLRINRLIVPARFQNSGTWLKYDFKYFNKLKRLFNTLRLFKNSNTFWRVENFHVKPAIENKTVNVQFSPEKKDKEQCLEYSFFSGFMQYIPFLSMHDEINNSKEMRYSIWNGEIYYQNNNLNKNHIMKKIFPYNWIVPINNNNKKILQITCEMISVDTNYTDYNLDFESCLDISLDKLVKTTNKNFLNKSDLKTFVLYTHALSAGGAERQWCNLAFGLKQLGHDVCLLVDNYEGSNGHYLNIARKTGISVIQISDEVPFMPSLKDNMAPDDLFLYFLIRDVKNLARLVTALKRIKPDAFIAQLDMINIMGATAALISNIPKIALSFRNYNPSNFDYIYTKWFLPSYKKLAQSHRLIFTGNSKLGNQDYAKWIGVEDDKIHLLNNSYMSESFKMLSTIEKQEFRLSLKISFNNPIILGVFRLSKEKNPILFINTCIDVLQHNQDAVVILCGEGNMYAELKALAAISGFSDRILLMGRQTEIWKFISIADVLLLTSDFEGTPNVVREALMLGCPVVATACGAVPEMINDGVNGHVAPIGDKKKLVEYLNLVLFNQDHRASLLNGIKMSQNEFTPKDMAAQLLKIINSSSS